MIIKLFELKKRIWWSYLEEDLQELFSESIVLLETASSWEQQFHDYSFVVFPAAKAYEGFLKKIFLDLKLINESDYYGKHFRIGKALNPSLPPKFRDSGWIYDDLTKYCNGEDLPKTLWMTWKKSRNQVFHWFPDERRALSLSEAEKRVELVIEAIDDFFSSCRVDLKVKNE